MQYEAPRLEIIAGEASVVIRNTNLYGGTPPSKSAESRAESFQLNPNTLYLLVSPLLWYGVPGIIERLPESSSLLAVEANGDLAEIAREQLPPELAAKKIPLVSPADADSLFVQLKKIGIESFRRVELISLNGGYRLYSRHYKTLKILLEEEIQQFWQNKYTLMHMLPLWVKNIFFNLAESSMDIRKPRFFDTTAVTDRAVCVVGAGPGMESHLAFLRKERSRLFLVVVDTACEMLYRLGIKADAVVIQEAQFYNLYDFIHIPGNNSEIWGDITGYPGVFRLSGGQINFFTGEFSKSDLFTRMLEYGLLPPLVPPLGSVGSTAVYLALRATRGPVFVAGLDFAFVAGKTHANGTPVHTLRLLQTRRLRPFEDLQALTARGIRSIESLVNPEYTEYFTDRNRLLTTVSLDRYSRNFSRFFSGEERLHQLLPRGLPLDISNIDHEKAGVILEEWEKNQGKTKPDKPAAFVTPGSETPASRDCFSPERVRGFLEKEKALLNKLYHDCRRYLEGGLAPGSEEAGELIKAINSMEYLFFHFPDTGYSLKKLDPTMVKRIMVSAGHFTGIVEKALSLVENTPL